MTVIAVGTPQSFRTTVARALEVEAEDVGWVQSVTAAEEILVDADAPVDVLVLSPEIKEPDALGLAEFVSRSAPGTAIVLVRDKTWNGLLPAAMRAGIRDVVDLKQGSEEIRDAVERAVVWAQSLRQTRGDSQNRSAERGVVISVFSSKGGTGKTFLATNLATAIADLSGKDTAVVDLDVDMGDVFSYFGAEPTKQVSDLISLGEGAPRETVMASSSQFGEHLYGFGAVPDPAMQPPAGEAIGKYLRVLRQNFGYVVVDASADYTDLALACFDLSDAICLVTGLDVVGVKHLSKALETLLSIGLPRDRFRIILNRADSKVGLDAGDVERVMKIEVDTLIPSSRLVPMSLNKGRPVYTEEPGSEVSASIRALAQRFTGGVEISMNGHGAVEEIEEPRRRRGLFRRT
ncbi:MAG: AAA family ATPase [Actinomycetota bacterium]